MTPLMLSDECRSARYQSAHYLTFSVLVLNVFSSVFAAGLLAVECDYHSKMLSNKQFTQNMFGCV